MTYRTWEERTKAPAPTDAPSLDRRETLWRVRAPSGRVWECVVYQMDSGRELRLQPEGKEDSAAMTQLLASGDADLEDLSARWRAAAIAKGFTEVP